MTSRSGGMDGALYISDGNPNLLGANRNDDGRRLDTYYDNPDNRWNRENGFAFVVSQFFSFSPYLGEFCFITCPLQPPSILPISSIFSERIIYLFVLRDLLSQRTKSKTLTVSIFLMDALI